MNISPSLRQDIEALLAQLNRDEDLNGGLISVELMKQGDKLRQSLHIQRQVFPKGNFNSDSRVLDI